MGKYLIVYLFVLIINWQNSSFAHEGHGDHHLHHSRDDHRTKYTFLVTDDLSALAVEAVKSIWKQYPFIKERIKFNIIDKTDFDSGLYYHDIEDSAIIVADSTITTILTKKQKGIAFESVKGAIDNGTIILFLNEPGEIKDKYLNASLTYDNEIIQYHNFGGAENFKNMTLYSLLKYADIKKIEHEPPKENQKALYSHRSILEQLWITGVLIAFSVFGIKVGLGLGSQLYSETVTTGRKLFVFVCALFSYLALFFVLYYIITHFNLLNYLDQFMSIVKYGMYMHLAVAFGLLMWGAKLLLKTSKDKQDITCRSCLLLILPCPVCSMAIFINLTLAYSLSTLTPFLTTIILFIIFCAITVLTLALIFPFRHKISTGSSFLGTSMSLIAVYFLLTLIFAPIYPKIKDVFTMASSNSPVNDSDSFYIIIFVGVALLLIVGGFIKSRYFSKGVLK